MQLIGALRPANNALSFQICATKHARTRRYQLDFLLHAHLFAIRRCCFVRLFCTNAYRASGYRLLMLMAQ